ncbi:MAG: ABC transporter ATP-binding protein/permease [Marinobacterium sp.]|nr:ABC transporter ATP-binding protein/permease [Marinobacterium sp.]
MWSGFKNQALPRVLAVAGGSGWPLLGAILLRLLDRLLALLPLLLLAGWLLIASPAGSMDALIAVDGMIAMDALVAILAGLCCLQLMIAIAAQLGMFRHSYQLVSDYRRAMINRVRQLPLMRTRGRYASEYSERLTEDINQLEGAFTHLLPELLASALLVVILLLVMLIQLPAAGLMLAAGLLAGIAVLQGLQQRFYAAAEARKQQFSHLSGLLLEFVSGLVTLRLFAATGWFKAKLQPGFQQLHDQAMQVEIRGALPVMAARLLLELSFVALLAWLCWQWQSSQLAAEPLLLAVLVGYQLLDSGSELFTQLTMLRYTLQSEQRVHQLTALAPLPEPARPAVATGATLELCNVHYRYPGVDRDVLQQLDVTIPAGSQTAIVGHSGSGKSTLLALLARFDDPQQGEIRAGGQPLTALGSEQVHRLISMVFQDVQLTGGSIRDNILLADPEIAPQRFEQVCQLSGCALLAQRLSDGLDTSLGEQGQPLSGGERQCIALARALLRDTPIILLDEATASLDVALQAQVRQGLACLSAGRTVISVAHRLETVRDADQILVLQQGRLVQSGTHAELVAQCGDYQRLWRAEL